MASRDSSTTRTKHIDLKYHHVRDMVQRGIIIFKHVPSWEQMADGFTKIETESILERKVERLGLNLHFNPISTVYHTHLPSAYIQFNRDFHPSLLYSKFQLLSTTQKNSAQETSVHKN